jgi:hypothetical protein
MKTGKQRLEKYSLGTDSEGVNFMNSNAGQFAGLANSLVGIIDSIGQDKDFQRQPTINRMTMRQMVTPYSNFAFGGELDGIDEGQLAQLQAMADEMGITIEELIAQLQQGEQGGEEDMMMEEEDMGMEEEFAFGGGVGGPGDETPGDKLKVIVTDEDRAMLKKDTYTRNLFGDQAENIYAAGFRPRTYANNQLIYTTDSNNFMTKEKKRMGYMPNKIGGLNRVLINDDGTYQNADDVNMEAGQVTADINRLYGGRLDQLLADNTAVKKTFAYGGKVGSKAIEVEGDEVLQFPGGGMAKAKGPTHEEGGIDVEVPAGTKIYSDRLSIDGKSMQERKVARERALSRVQKALEKNPSDKINKNTYERVAINLALEEKEDMALQKAAKAIMGNPGEAAYGDEVDPYDPFGVRELLTIKNNVGGYIPKIAGSGTIGDDTIDPDLTVKSKAPTTMGSLTPNPVTDRRIKSNKSKMDAAKSLEGDDFTTGDWVGMAGTAISGLMPLLNTLSNRAGDAPNINRFQGFGREAIEENRKAQETASTLKGGQLTDIDIAGNTAKARNRNSALSVNTLRALDAVTDMGMARAKQGAADSFSKTMMGLYGQRSQLENVQDQVVMTGETRRDLEDKMDRDANYTALAENYTNLGTQVQAAGRNLNISRGNTTDKKLLSQLSQYGLSFDDDGNLVSI